MVQSVCFRHSSVNLLFPVTTWALISSLIDIRSTGVWDDYHVVDGRLVTGQNPASAASTATAAVEAFEKL